MWQEVLASVQYWMKIDPQANIPNSASQFKTKECTAKILSLSLHIHTVNFTARFAAEICGGGGPAGDLEACSVWFAQLFKRSALRLRRQGSISSCCGRIVVFGKPFTAPGQSAVFTSSSYGLKTVIKIQNNSNVLEGVSTKHFYHVSLLLDQGSLSSY